MKRRSIRAVVAVFVISAVVIVGTLWGRRVVSRLKRAMLPQRTISDVIHEVGKSARDRLEPEFRAVDVVYPPSRLALLAMKSERRLEVWADSGQGWTFVHSYPILAASGGPGPKLVEGDRQVPEGIYRIAALNANSSYHLSMKLDYPNDFDRLHAFADQRTNLGGDIFIHGKAASIGCLAIGDKAIEDLFVLVNDTGLSNVEVAVAPIDPRAESLQVLSDAPAWVAELYANITVYFQTFVRTGP